jgi:hypothetical protein
MNARNKSARVGTFEKLDGKARGSIAGNVGTTVTERFEHIDRDEQGFVYHKLMCVQEKVSSVLEKCSRLA